MQINIEVTQAELDEMDLDQSQLIIHVLETLDGDSTGLVGYDVNVNVTYK